MEETEVVLGKLIEAGEDTAVLLEFADGTLDQVPLLIQLLIVRTLGITVSLGRNNGFSPGCTNQVEDGLGVISLIAEHELHLVAFD